MSFSDEVIPATPSKMSQMKALNFDPKTKRLSLIVKEIPKIKNADDVIVRVTFSGICGTDLHITEGSFPCKDSPLTLGHEFSGLVTQTGKDVTHVKTGDKVVVDPNRQGIGCNKCSYCTNGKYHLCTSGGINNTIGIFRDGGWAEYCIAPACQVFKLPSNISLQTAAMCEPLSCISHGWERLGSVPSYARFIIQGAGIIGNLWATLLHLKGYKYVTVSEPLAKRRELFEKIGTGYEILSPDQLKAKFTNEAAVLEKGFDICIDCSGNATAIESGFSYLRPGGKLCIFGVASPNARINLSPFDIYKKEITIMGVMVNPFSFNKAIALLDSMSERYLKYDILGIKVFGLDQHEEALVELKQGKISKAVFKIC
ncbi:hypothetical protein J437_LFUL003019 [Ladona fulva]|uniref:Uncharacterized protein n=1 Tax=Ladona fulva TaxID=123851 RepID=A0A8K0JTX7_LADFU|nr:hypothetical protein J437_LFUL003019 [Ladona fulva]